MLAVTVHEGGKRLVMWAERRLFVFAVEEVSTTQVKRKPKPQSRLTFDWMILCFLGSLAGKN